MRFLPLLAIDFRPVALALATAILAGCATFSADGGFGAVERTAQEGLGKEIRWVRSAGQRNEVQARVAELLAKPLGVEEAVQVALFNNRRLQAAFFELGIGEADLVQAGRLPNPRFSMLRASQAESGGREYKIEQALSFNLFALIAMPLAVEVEQRHFERRSGWRHWKRCGSRPPRARPISLDFQDALRIARAVANTPPLSLSGTAAGHIAGQAQSSAPPYPLKYHTPAQPSADGNTVEMDVERSKFAENSVMWEFSRDRVSGHFKMMMEMLQSLKN